MNFWVMFGREEIELSEEWQGRLGNCCQWGCCPRRGQRRQARLPDKAPTLRLEGITSNLLEELLKSGEAVQVVVVNNEQAVVPELKREELTSWKTLKSLLD